MLAGKPVNLNPQTVTTHGESCLPWAGGVSHSVVAAPQLAFPEFISYGKCETFAEGLLEGTRTTTTVRASVDNVRLTTSPSPTDEAPDIVSFSFSAANFSLALQSFYPYNGSPSFKIIPVAPVGMSLVGRAKKGADIVLPVTLNFDQQILTLSTAQEFDELFLKNREFFDEQTSRFPSHQKLVFGTSRMPRTPQGYIVTSFVRAIQVGNDVIAGNVLARKGFGTVQFGTVLADSFNRRIMMASVKMGSDPAGSAGMCGVETNGIWP
jgi:hypothetical protein